jgi:hypothetical protein
MFARVRSERDIGNDGVAIAMSLEQKWRIVYAHELDRLEQLKKRETAIKKAAGASSVSMTRYR